MRAKKTIYTHNVAKKTNYDDRITLNGARPTIVPQYDGEWPPFAEVLSSMSPERRPSLRHAYGIQTDRLYQYFPIMFDAPPEMKWCPHCGDWRHQTQFNKDSTRGDGLDGWCKACRASERKRRDWLMRDSELLYQQWHDRHISRLYSEQTETEQAA